jgi:putative nucleotidyltransferase with HDIG domain
MTTLQDRLKGAYLGSIIGDALGTKIEFLTKQKIRQRYGTAEEYLQHFTGSDSAPISDETILLNHSMRFYLENGHYLEQGKTLPAGIYEDHLGKLSELGLDELRHKGFSDKMRKLFFSYHENPFAQNPFTNNRGSGFVPLVLPITASVRSAKDLASKITQMTPKTHADADPVWTQRYFAALYAILHEKSIYGSIRELEIEHYTLDEKLKMAISGNVEAIETVEGSADSILPAAIALYIASQRDFEKMVELAFTNFQKADFDTLFFATGALIGASIGQYRIPEKLTRPIIRITELTEKINGFVDKQTRNDRRCDEHDHTDNRTDNLTHNLADARNDSRNNSRKYAQLKFLVLADLDTLLSDKTKTQLFTLVPELETQDNYDSGQPRHCYTLLEHTMRTVDALPSNDTTLRIAALLHDVAKPFVRGEKEGRTIYHHHAETGARMASEILSRLGAEEDEQSTVCRLVDEHVINYEQGWSDKAIRRFARRNEDILDKLFLLASADSNAQLPGKDELTELHERLTTQYSQNKTANKAASERQTR